MSEGPQHRLRGTFEQIREAHVQFSFAQTDRVIHVGKGKEFNGERGQARAGAQFAETLLEDCDNPVSHLEG